MTFANWTEGSNDSFFATVPGDPPVCGDPRFLRGYDFAYPGGLQHKVVEHERHRAFQDDGEVGSAVTISVAQDKRAGA